MSVILEQTLTDDMNYYRSNILMHINLLWLAGKGVHALITITHTVR